jgi:curved DNA-binding protein
MGPDDLSGFSDFFASIFGGRGFEGGFGAGGDFRGFDAQGQDQHARIRLSLEEAYQGVTRNLQLESTEVDAQGRVIRRPRSLKVRIPAGATEGRRIRLAGQGGRGREGHPNGDLYLEVELLPHRFFRAEGRDVYLELPVAPWEAALGANVPVPTLGGTVNLRVPAGSQSGNKLRLKGRGLPGKPPGDEYVVLQVRVPEASGEAARRLYQEMAEQLAFNPRAELGV